MMKKKLCKSKNDYVFFGVAGGLGEYFGIDAMLVRLGFVILTVLGGAGPVIYILMAIMMPEARAKKEKVEVEEMEIEEEGEKLEEKTGGEEKTSSDALAYILIGVGIYGLLRQILPMDWFSLSNIWPVALIIGGVYLIVRK